MGIFNILGRGDVDAEALERDGYFTGAVEEVLSTSDNSEDLPDYTDEVISLGKSPDKIWQNSEPDAFKKDGKINFLHLDESGVFTLTIFKPGSKTVLNAQIEPEIIGEVRSKLQGMKDWDKSSSSETWDKADGDKDGNTYMFNRSLTFFEEPGLDWKLQWEWRHKNRWNIVEVRDTLRFVKVPPIILGEM